MIYTGIVSVTFRKFSPKEVIKLSKDAGIDGIEWGGDVHVPHGDTAKANEVYKMTVGNGLKVASYGSYYRLGVEKKGVDTFKSVLETAVELKAPVIRVWAGNKGSADADRKWWRDCIEESRKIASMALKQGIRVAFEYHNKTLTDTVESAVKFMDNINHKNIRSYWQPLRSMNLDEQMDGLKKILPWLENIHVHYMTSEGREPLANGEDEWMKYLNIARELEKDLYAMIEFVKDHDPNQFFEDVKTLKQLLAIT